MTHYHPQGLTTTKKKSYNHRMQEKYCKTTCSDPIAPRNLRQQVPIIHGYPKNATTTDYHQQPTQ